MASLPGNRVLKSHINAKFKKSGEPSLKKWYYKSRWNDPVCVDQHTDYQDNEVTLCFAGGKKRTIHLDDYNKDFLRPLAAIAVGSRVSDVSLIHPDNGLSLHPERGTLPSINSGAMEVHVNKKIGNLENPTVFEMVHPLSTSRNDKVWSGIKHKITQSPKITSAMYDVARSRNVSRKMVDYLAQKIQKTYPFLRKADAYNKLSEHIYNHAALVAENNPALLENNTAEQFVVGQCLGEQQGGLAYHMHTFMNSEHVPPHTEGAEDLRFNGVDVVGSNIPTFSEMKKVMRKHNNSKNVGAKFNAVPAHQARKIKEMESMNDEFEERGLPRIELFKLCV